MVKAVPFKEWLKSKVISSRWKKSTKQDVTGNLVKKIKKRKKNGLVYLFHGKKGTQTKAHTYFAKVKRKRCFIHQIVNKDTQKA